MLKVKNFSAKEEKEIVDKILTEKAEKDLDEGVKPKVADEAKNDKSALADLKRIGKFQLVTLEGERYTVVNKTLQRVCPIMEGRLGFTYCSRLVTRFNMTDPEQKAVNQKRGQGHWATNEGSPEL